MSISKESTEEEVYEYAKEIFRIELNREADMNKDTDMLIVSAISKGIEHTLRDIE